MTVRALVPSLILGMMGLFGALGCGKPDLPPLEIADGCQPLLAGKDCLLPYPSDYFLEEDPSLPSGHRITLAKVAKPKTDQGGSADVGEWKPADGASRFPMPTALMSTPLSDVGLQGYFGDPEKTKQLDSPTLIIDAATGERIPHMAELDARATSPDKQAIVLRPLVSLKARARYVVAFQKLQTPEGSSAPAPEGFRRIRDRETRGDSKLDPVAKEFEEKVFPVLDQLAVPREGLQLAWTFSVGSDEWIASDLLQVREATRAWLEKNTPRVEVTSVAEGSEPGIWRTIRGTFEAPLFLTVDGKDGLLMRAQDGTVIQNGTAQVPFLALIPNELKDPAAPGVALGYAHGSFANRDEILSAHPIDVARQSKAVMFAIDCLGMSNSDVGRLLTNIMQKPTQVMSFTDRVPQGMANWIALYAAIAGPLRELPAFVNASGKPVYTPDASKFIGISQGHILGGVLAAVHPGLRRVVLSSGGAAFSHMVARSRPLNSFFYFLAMTPPLERRKLEATLQPYFDRIDGVFWANHVLKNPLPGALERRVLMQIGLGDVEVPNIGAFMHAQALGLSLLQPAPISVYGLPGATSPSTESALALFDMGADLHEVYALPRPYTSENDVHLGARMLPAAMRQLEAFFGPTDQIRHVCDGPCDPN